MEPDRPFVAAPRFVIRREIGAGGMGVVYEAYDQELGEVVALKTLHHADGQWLARFKHEFRSLHDLSHRNVVALGEFFDGELGPYFTMELVRGVTFLEHVRGADRPARATDAVSAGADFALAAGDAGAAGALPAEPTAQVAPIAFDERRLRAALGQLAMGIAALHQAGMVHRDIKPSNILVTATGRVVVLDFGLVAASASPQRSSTGAAVGTLDYMAPEQAMAGEVAPTADWYSMGVVLYEALTGAVPHVGRTPYEIILQKQAPLPASPRQRVPTVPADLDALCTDLLAPSPDARPRVRQIFDRLGVVTTEEVARVRSRPASEVVPRTPFVGRAAELAALRAAYDRAHAGPVVALIEGISGVGKSQLAERFLEHLAHAEPDALVLTSRCYEREVVPYKAFDGIADGLARFLNQLPAAQVAAVMPLRPTLLARLFPVLKQVEAVAAAAAVADLPDPHDQRRRMFTSLRELFLRLTVRRRLVWYIDDLHWTDADSLVLLQELIAHEQRLPVFIVATIRPIDDAPRRALAAQVAALAPTVRVPLGELSPEEGRALAVLLLPTHAAATRDAVAADAAGHPLLLQELARHVSATAGAAVPAATLEEMLAVRIARLAPEAQALLEVVAVFGGPVPQDVAALAAGLSSAAQIQAAAVLRAGHLVRTDGVRRTDRIVPAHDRVREHVAARLEPARLQQVHERLALALEQTGAAAVDPRTLVRHARAAGRHALAATYARAAARHAAAALAFDQAAEFYATAIELGDDDPAALRALRLDLAAALVNAGRGPDAAEVFMRAAEGADPAVRLDCQQQAAEQWIITGHVEQGMATLRSSLIDIGEPLAASPRRALASVLWNRTRLRLRGLRYRARRESQVPVETLRRLDALRAVAHGLAMVDNIRGADFNGRLLLLALRTGEVRRLVGAIATEVVFLVSQGAIGRGRRLFDELVELAEACPDQAYGRTWVLLADGAASFFEGRFTRAVAALGQAEDVFADGPTGLTFERNNVRVFRVHALRLLGALREQDALITELVRGGRQRGDRYLETTLRLLQGQALLARDDLAEARRSIEDATWTSPEHGFHLQHWYELRARVELALYTGTAPAAAAALVGQFAALDRSMLLRVRIVQHDAIWLRARLALAAGGGDGPVHAAARQLARAGVGYATVYALLLRAGLSARAPGPAMACLRQAIELAETHDMALHLAAARDRLGRLVGGAEGAALRAAAARYAAEQRIVAPDRMFEIVAPGLLHE